jgi:hypothetical protein
VFPTAPSDSSVGISVGGASYLNTTSLDGGSAIRGFSSGMIAGDQSAVSIFVANDLTPRFLVEQNRGSGMTAIASSLTVVGHVVVRNNPIGMVAIDGAALQLSNGVQIVANDTGLSMRTNAAGRIITRTNFGGSTGTAVSLTTGATLDFAGGEITFAGNAVDIFCDAYSLASRVSLTNASTVNCPNAN